MFHAQYMLALGHYERATNELNKAIAMMENNDHRSAYLHSNASAAQGLIPNGIKLRKSHITENVVWDFLLSNMIYLY